MEPKRMQLLKEAWRLDRGGEQEAALAAYQAFLRLEPLVAVAWADLGGLLLVMARLDEAEAACRRAVELDPDHETAQINLASTLLARDQVDAAEALCRRIVAQFPRTAMGRACLSDCLARTGGLEEALILVRSALTFAPDRPDLRNRLREYSIMAGDLEPLCQDPPFSGPAAAAAERELEQAHIRILKGDLPRGWDLFEARLRGPEPNRQVWPFTEPEWDGAPFPGRTLLLHWEQGMGDTIMYARYAAKVKALGGRVLVTVQPQLADLMATCPGVDQVVAHGHPLPPFNLRMSLVSLPRVFRTDLASIPARIPYLDVPGAVPNRAGLMKALVGAGGRTKVGLVWAGNPNHKRDHLRSLTPETLAPLAALPGVAWYSLQLGVPQPPPLPGLVPLAPLLGSFSDTAYALSGLDLLITVDTSVAHLAGALGVPTLVLLPCLPDSRWMLGRRDSPWYPTLRLYRQTRVKDWGSVIDRVLQDLR